MAAGWLSLPFLFGSFNRREALVGLEAFFSLHSSSMTRAWGLTEVAWGNFVRASERASGSGLDTPFTSSPPLDIVGIYPRWFGGMHMAGEYMIEGREKGIITIHGIALH